MFMQRQERYEYHLRMPEILETIAQCKAFLMQNPNSIYMYFDSRVMTQYHVVLYTQRLQKYASATKHYQCALYDIQKCKFSQNLLHKEGYIGVLFFQNRCLKASNSTYELELFKRTLDRLETMKEQRLVKHEPELTMDKELESLRKKYKPPAKKKKKPEKQSFKCLIL